MMSTQNPDQQSAPPRGPEGGAGSGQRGVFSGLLACLLLAVGYTSTLNASTPEDHLEWEYARLGDTVLTHEQVDAALAGIESNFRAEFIRDSKKVENLLRRVLLDAYLADQARKAKFDQEQMIVSRVELAVNKALASMWIDHQVEQAPPADFEAMAKEYWVFNPDRFVLPETYDATHLLISTRDRGEEEAQELAVVLLEQIHADPARFDDLVMSHSEDPSVKSNDGHFSDVVPGQMVKPFEEAVMRLEKPGDISGLVKTRFGVHIIRLDGRKGPRTQPFDQVKQRLIADQKEKHEERVRNDAIFGALGENTVEVIPGAPQKMLQRYLGEGWEEPQPNP